jgi:hypothetical protein
MAQKSQDQSLQFSILEQKNSKKKKRRAKTQTYFSKSMQHQSGPLILQGSH